MVNVAAAYEHPGEAAVHEPWVSAFAAALRQGDTGAYIGFLADDSEARVRDAYPGATWDRLAAIKGRATTRAICSASTTTFRRPPPSHHEAPGTLRRSRGSQNVLGNRPNPYDMPTEDDRLVCRDSIREPPPS